MTAGDRIQTLQLTGGDGFLSANEKRQTIGLGNATAIQRLEMCWPNGRVDEWSDLPVDVHLDCIEGRPSQATQLAGPD